eukprot:UN1742
MHHGQDVVHLLIHAFSRHPCNAQDCTESILLPIGAIKVPSLHTSPWGYHSAMLPWLATAALPMEPTIHTLCNNARLNTSSILPTQLYILIGNVNKT